MKEGTCIYCDSREELIRNLKELVVAGYRTIVLYFTNTIVITSVPEMEEV